MATYPAAIVSDVDHGDQLALRMMLSYVEAECLRIGATEAARHAAMAAANMPRGALPTPPRPSAQPRRQERLH